MTTKYKLEYIWLDGKTPVPDLRGKTSTQSILRNRPLFARSVPNWGFDGSSTMQGRGQKL